jgi:parallel beta-helix repeat protein
MKAQNITSGLNLFLNFAITFLFSLAAFAGNYTWTGTTSSSWTTSTNWSPNGNPSTNDTVTIGTGSNNCVMSANTAVMQFSVSTDTIDFNGYTLTVSGNTTISGGFATNGALIIYGTGTTRFTGGTLAVTVNATAGSVQFSGSTFNNPVIAVKTGSGSSTGAGGCTFNSTVTLIDSGTGFWTFGNTNTDSWTEKVTVIESSTGVIYFAHNSSDNEFFKAVTFTNTSSGRIYCDYYGSSTFHDTILVNSTSSGPIYFGFGNGTTTLDTSIISIGSLGLSSTGSVSLAGIIQQDASKSISLTGTGSSAISFGAGSIFEGRVTASAPALSLDGSHFNNVSSFTHTGSSTNSSVGGCYFGDSTLIFHNNSTGGALYTGTSATDTFAAPVTIQNSNKGKIGVINAQFNYDATFINYSKNVSLVGSSTPLNDSYTFLVADAGNCFFQDSLTIFCDTSSMSFGTSSGRATFNVFGSLIVDSSYYGNLLLANTECQDSTDINFPFENNPGMLFLDSNNIFNGKVNCDVQHIQLNGSTYNDNFYLKTTCLDSDTSKGGNIFNGSSVFVDSNTVAVKSMILAFLYPDDFNGDVTFKQYGIGRIYPCHTKNSTFSQGIAVDGSDDIIFGSNGGRMIIDGSNNHTFNKLGINQALIKKLEIKKDNRLFTLNAPMTITDSAFFTKGFMSADSVRPFIIADNCIVTGASDSSYVIGLVKKVGNDGFSFPLGAEGYYHPLSISAPSSSSATFTAEYIFNDHGLGISCDSTMELPSVSEYWKLERLVANDSVIVTLGWNVNSSNVVQLLGMKVAYWNNVEWKDYGNSATTGDLTYGTVSSSGTANSFGYFTIANVKCYLTVNVGNNQFISVDSSAMIGVSPASNNGYSPVTYMWSTGATTETVSGMTTGNYTLTVTDAKGCLIQGNVNVNGPSILATVYNCEDASIVFFGGALGASNVWDFGDGSAVVTTGATSVSHTYAYPGIFTVIFSSNGIGYLRNIVILPSVAGVYNSGCCINSFSNFSFDNFNLTTTTTWSGLTRTIKGTFTVKTGVSLTISNSSDIQFGPLGKIVVEPGATLTVTSNSILRALQLPCGKMMWQGIEVWGNSSSSLLANQGQVLVNNGATIEDAYNAIFVGRQRLLRYQYNPPDWGFQISSHYTTYGGGRVQVSGATFNRCAHGVVFYEYPFSNNLSSILSSTFTSLTNGANSSVLDPYYNGTANYFHTDYLAYHNPFYVRNYGVPNQSLVGRPLSFIYAFGKRNIRVFGNSFNYSREGIFGSGESRFVIGNSVGGGNNFTENSLGIYILNSNTSLIGQLIDNNDFSYSSQTEANASAGMIIQGSAFSSVKNNIFNGSNFGISMQFSSNFLVADNQFDDCHGRGVHSYYAGTAASEIGYLNQGNIFNDCYLGSTALGQNDLLRIRCNISNHPSTLNYAAVWDVDLSSLTNQGSFSTTDVQAPAGNLFNNNKKDLRTYALLPFTYFHHIQGVTQPVQANGYLGLTTSQDPINLPSNYDDACGGSCDPPFPPCFNAAISSQVSTIEDLEDDVDNIESAIDGGNTSFILASIIADSVNNSTLETRLINNSPLSDTALLAVISYRDSLPSTSFADIFIPNLPCSKEVFNSLVEILDDLDQGDEDTIRILQGFNPNYATITGILRNIESHELERQLLVNALVRHYVDSDSVSYAIDVLEAESFLEAKHALVGHYLIEQNYSIASEILESLPLSTSRDSAYYELYNIYIELAEDTLTIWDLDSAQEAKVRQIAMMCPPSLAKANAQAVMYIVYGEPIDTCDLGSGLRSAQTQENNDYNVLTPAESMYLGSIVPNPFSDFTFVHCNIPKENSGILKIYDLNGNIIQSFELREGPSAVKISLADFSSGVYLCQLYINNLHVMQQKKLILIK